MNEMTMLHQSMTALDKMILAGTLPESEATWGGAGVIIKPVLGKGSEMSRYPDDLYVITPHSRLVVAVVERLRDLFYDAEVTDHLNKYEFFGRLATAMNDVLTTSPNADGRQLGLAAVREARTFLRDWTDNAM
jgi:hypothetical protein